jgi:hypothetical protein
MWLRVKAFPQAPFRPKCLQQFVQINPKALTATNRMNESHHQVI